jgi:outer membrane immunogenic protein
MCSAAKAEYIDRSTFITPVALAPFGSFRDDEHTFKVGLNYRFDWAGEPIAARY